MCPKASLQEHYIKYYNIIKRILLVEEIDGNTKKSPKSPILRRPTKRFSSCTVGLYPGFTWQNTNTEANEQRLIACVSDSKIAVVDTTTLDFKIEKYEPKRIVDSTNN